MTVYILTTNDHGFDFDILGVYASQALAEAAKTYASANGIGDELRVTAYAVSRSGTIRNHPLAP